MKKFRAKKYKALISTNLLACGIDIRSINLVLSFDIPISMEKKHVDYDNYLHRMGRTGRFGDKGLGISILDKTP